MNLTERERETVLMLAECDMNVSEVGRRSYWHRNTILYYAKSIKGKTGLSPNSFYDLVKLVEMVKVADA